MSVCLKAARAMLAKAGLIAAVALSAAATVESHGAWHGRTSALPAALRLRGGSDGAPDHFDLVVIGGGSGGTCEHGRHSGARG